MTGNDIHYIGECLLSDPNWLAQLKSFLGSGTERSEAPQGCLPSPTGSAPERSGGAEAGGDYLRRSAPVSDSVEDVNEWKCPACGCSDTWFDRTIFLYADGKTEGMATRCCGCGRDIDEPTSTDDPSAAGSSESVATDGGSSGAQARNAKVSASGVNNQQP